MFFKKFAMFIMTAGFVSGIFLQPVSGQAEVVDQTDAAVETTAPNDQKIGQNTEVDTKKDSSADRIDITQEGQKEEAKGAVEAQSAANIPAPAVATPQIVKITNNITTTSGKKTVKPKKKKADGYNKAELRLMASIINCEAGGESFQGQVAVGIVVMNRVKSDLFPNSIKKVIYQKGQFSPVRNGMLRKKLKQYDAGRIHNAQWKSCIKAAKQALGGRTVIKLKGKTKSMKGVRFFSVHLKGAKFRLGGHRFR